MEQHTSVLQISARPALFARQGSVKRTWRKRNGKTFGPYYHFCYNDCGRKCVIYLGRDGPLVRHIRHMLEKLQKPLRKKRMFDRIERETRAKLRDNKRRLSVLLRPLGLRMQGFEVRGWRTSFLRPPLPRLPRLLPNPWSYLPRIPIRIKMGYT